MSLNTPTRSSAAQPEPGDRFHGQDGLHGEVEHLVGDRIILRLSDGTRVLMGADRLDHQGDDGWSAGLTRADMERARTSRARTAGSSTSGQSAAGTDDMIVLPVIEEQLEVGKQTVETGRVHVHKLVREEQQEIVQDLLRQEVRVERVPLNQPVEDAANPPQPRHEGQTLVIPLLEEQLVVEKRVVLREELRISRISDRQPTHQTVTLRKEQAQVERLAPKAT